MNDPKDTENQASTDVREPSRPFCPEIKGEVRRQLFAYARKNGRSATNAVIWILGEWLRKAGF